MRLTRGLLAASLILSQPQTFADNYFVKASEPDIISSAKNEVAASKNWRYSQVYGSNIAHWLAPRDYLESSFPLS
jgi:hypothetical protein